MKELSINKKQSISSKQDIIKQTIDSLNINLSKKDFDSFKESNPLLENASQKEMQNILKQALASEAVANTVKLFSKAKSNKKFDFGKVTASFLADYQSEPTKKAYSYGLGKLKQYLNNNYILLLSWEVSDARSYARTIKAKYSTCTANLIINTARAFFSYLTAHKIVVSSPMYKIKQAKSKKTNKIKQLPSLEDVKGLIKRLNIKGSRDIAQAIKIMAFAGVRVGGLVNSEVTRDNIFITHSKGKDFRVKLPKELKGLLNRKLFQGYTAPALSKRINHKLAKEFKKGGLAVRCSCHTFRHFFAVTQYKKDKDILRLKALLNHGDISTTQGYLVGLNLITQEIDSPK